MKKSLSKRKIIFDFDGTIVDVYLKYYKILNDYLEKISVEKKIEFLEYIEKKRTLKKDHLIVKDIVTEKEFNIDNYVIFKRKNLEKIKYLKYDSLIENCTETLALLLKCNYDIELLSKRENKINLLRQLSWLNIRKYFTSVVTVKSFKSKYTILKNKKDAIMIGDSPDDIESAQKAGLTSFFVTSGLFLAEDIVNLEGCILINNINELTKYIN